MSPSIWQSIWFQALPAEVKLAYLFLLNNSGAAGVWKGVWPLLASICKIGLTLQEFLEVAQSENPLESDDQQTPRIKSIEGSRTVIWLARACKEAVYESIALKRRRDMREMVAELEKYNLTDMLRVYCPDVRIVGKPDKRELSKAGAVVKENLEDRIPALKWLVDKPELWDKALTIAELKSFFFHHEASKWTEFASWRDALSVWVKDCQLRRDWAAEQGIPWPQSMAQKQKQITRLRQAMELLANDKEIPVGGTVPIIRKEARLKLERLNQFLQLLKMELQP